MEYFLGFKIGIGKAFLFYTRGRKGDMRRITEFISICIQVKVSVRIDLYQGQGSDYNRTKKTDLRTNS